MHCDKQPGARSRPAFPRHLSGKSRQSFYQDFGCRRADGAKEHFVLVRGLGSSGIALLGIRAVRPGIGGCIAEIPIVLRCGGNGQTSKGQAESRTFAHVTNDTISSVRQMEDRSTRPARCLLRESAVYLFSDRDESMTRASKCQSVPHKKRSLAGFRHTRGRMLG